MSDARTGEPRYLDAGTHSIAVFRGRGVNDGPMGPANATGRSLDPPFCEILRVEDGRITGGDIYYDAMSMFAQLGVVEAPAPPERFVVASSGNTGRRPAGSLRAAGGARPGRDDQMPGPP